MYKNPQKFMTKIRKIYSREEDRDQRGEQLPNQGLLLLVIDK